MHRTAKHRMLSAERELLQLDYFNQKSSAEPQNVENSTYACAADHASKGKIILSALGATFLDHMMTCDSVRAHIPTPNLI